MQEDILGKVAVDLLSVPPLIFRFMRRKLIRTTLADIDTDIKLPHFEIMIVLKEEGVLHPAEIGEKLQIAKAQMTYLIDKLFDLGLVKRDTDSDDRRTLNIALTEKGSTLLEEHETCLINAVREIMSSLNDKELQALSDSLRNLRDTLFKLQ
jgi:DNA-binding MarR family transcriptional regulator